MFGYCRPLAVGRTKGPQRLRFAKRVPVFDLTSGAPRLSISHAGMPDYLQENPDATVRVSRKAIQCALYRSIIVFSSDGKPQRRNLKFFSFADQGS